MHYNYLIMISTQHIYAVICCTVIIAKVREVRENIKRNRLIWRIIQLWCFHHYHIVILIYLIIPFKRKINSLHVGV